MSYLIRISCVKNLFSVVFIILSVLFVFPQKTQAIGIPVVDIALNAQTTASTAANPITAFMTTAEKILNYIANPFARLVMRAAIQRLTAQTVNWINSGFQGNPAFITNSSQFFLDVADSAASGMLSEGQLNKLCTPFRAQVRLALVKNYLQEENNNYTCTLDIIKNNYEAFTRDFTQGGWDGWFEMTQTSGGNPYSAYFAAESGLAKVLGSQEDKYAKQVDQGRGFLSYQKCIRGTEFTQAQVDAWNAVYPDNPRRVGDCNEQDKETATPGSVIETQLQNSLGTGIKQYELAKSFDEVVNALVTQLFTRVLGSQGLRDGSGTPIPVPPPVPQGLPTITLLANSPVYVQFGTRFVDPGAFAFDSTDGDISSRITKTGSVDTSVLGTYTITYNVTNSRGVSAIPVTLTVIVVNDVPPEEPPGGTDPGTPGEPPSNLSTMCASVITERARIPGENLTQEQLRTILNNVARSNNSGGWGMLSKTDGNNCIGVSCDIMFHGPTCYIYDVLADSEGRATPTCNFAGGNMDRGRWVGVGSDTRGTGSCGTVTPPGGGTPPPGGGSCADPGNSTANYTGALITPENAVLTNNPTLAASLNNTANSQFFVAAVALQLRSSGYQASSNVLNGNNVLHAENYVAVWQSADTVVERYEAVNHAGDGDMTLRQAAQADFSGDIPLSCAR